MILTILTPTLPPDVCGVGDHSVNFAHALREHAERVTAIHVRCPNPAPGLPFDRIDHWDRRPDSLSGLLERHGTECLWLQYSGYGYAYQGLPEFLVRALQQVDKRIAVAVYFHQIHCRAGQLGWKGVFIAPRQRSIATRLARRADVVLTSCELYRRAIAKDCGVANEKLHQLPIGSNIPIPIVEPSERLRLRSLFGWSGDLRVAIAFGSSGTQAKALRENRQSLKMAVETGAIHRIVCVGGAPSSPPLDLADSCASAVRPIITELGHQPPRRIAELLLAADVAVTGNERRKFAKSGTMMAFAMAGLPVLVADAGDSSHETNAADAFVPTISLDELAQLAADDHARIHRQRLAAERIGWPALADQATKILSPICHASGAAVHGK